MNEELETQVSDELAKYFKDPIDKECSYCEAAKAIIPMIEKAERERIVELSELMEVKRISYSVFRRAIRAGRINREPCASCGKSQVEAHHEDYSQPLLIVWLCPDCHRNIHLKEQK